MRHRRYLMLVLAAVTLGSLALAQSGESEKPVVTSAVVPIYPPIAEATRASGDVTVEVEVDREGKVVAANTDSKNTLLSKVAEEAARRWGGRSFSTWREEKEGSTRLLIPFNAGRSFFSGEHSGILPTIQNRNQDEAQEGCG